jgi:hypothetical protein
MLRIRSEQMQRLSERPRQNFESAMVDNVRRNDPEQFKAIGEPGVREAVRYGIERAATYGIERGEGVAFYVALMFVLGRDFGVDPDYPWASEILTMPHADEQDKMDALRAEADEHAGEGEGLNKRSRS